MRDADSIKKCASLNTIYHTREETMDKHTFSPRDFCGVLFSFRYAFSILFIICIQIAITIPRFRHSVSSELMPFWNMNDFVSLFSLLFICDSIVFLTRQKPIIHFYLHLTVPCLNNWNDFSTPIFRWIEWKEVHSPRENDITHLVWAIQISLHSVSSRCEHCVVDTFIVTHFQFSF